MNELLPVTVIRTTDATPTPDNNRTTRKMIALTGLTFLAAAAAVAVAVAFDNKDNETETSD